jgi:hypothetical protein
VAASDLPILLLKIAKITVEDSKFHATGQFLSRALKENITTRKGVGIDISWAESVSRRSSGLSLDR